MINITTVDDGAVERANAVLAGFPGGAKKALGSALKRAAVTDGTSICGESGGKVLLHQSW